MPEILKGFILCVQGLAWAGVRAVSKAQRISVPTDLRTRTLEAQSN